MKKIIVLLMVLFGLFPLAYAIDTGTGISPDIGVEAFEPLIWDCGSRVVEDDPYEWGRYTNPRTTLYERLLNYAFTGETIIKKVLVMDKNGINKIEDVWGGISPYPFTPGGTADLQDPDDFLIQVNCQVNRTDQIRSLLTYCNPRILEEQITTFDPLTMAFYDCVITVEDPMCTDSTCANVDWQGEAWLNVIVCDLTGQLGDTGTQQCASLDENEFWFFNPIIALAVDGEMDFGNNVRPGTTAYSDTILVQNAAETGSGVMLDMFISGTDFYDSSSQGTQCPTSNVLSLSNFRYYAVNGAYSTLTDTQTDSFPAANDVVDRNRDTEGYINIEYGTSFTRNFYNNAEIMQAGTLTIGGAGNYYSGNILSPGSEMAITFKLNLPEPCNGNFDSGSIYFWAEAI